MTGDTLMIPDWVKLLAIMVTALMWVVTLKSRGVAPVSVFVIYCLTTFAVSVIVLCEVVLPVIGNALVVVFS